MEKPKESKKEKALRKLILKITRRKKKLRKKKRLRLVRKLKLKYFKRKPRYESRLIRKMSLITFMELLLFADVEGNSDNEGFQKKYFQFLLNASYIRHIHDEVRAELIRVLKTRKISYSQIKDLWYTLESNYLVWPDVVEEILPASKLYIEETILDWLSKSLESNVHVEDLFIRYYAELSAQSRPIFCTLTAVFDEFQNLLIGNDKVQDMIYYYVSLVQWNCQKRGRSFFTIYPKKYTCLVPFLCISPKTLSALTPSECELNYQTEVLKILMNAFRRDQENIIILLTHFPDWIMEFSDYIDDIWWYE